MISKLEHKIDQLSDIIARQERDLKQINPSIEKTHEMEERLNNTNKLIAEIRETSVPSPESRAKQAG